MFLKILKDSGEIAVIDAPAAPVEVTPEQQMVWAEVYAPDRPDVDGEFMTREDIREMAHTFMKSGKLDQIDLQHDNKVVKGCHVVESFIARDDDEVFLPGSWVVGVHVDDADTWDKVKKGELNGFSMEAYVLKEEVDVEIEIPPVVTGSTSVHKSDDGSHSHKFFVTYDEEGKFLGGITDDVSGHKHVIKAGTITEEVDGHRHRFSSVDNLIVREVPAE